MEEREAIAKLKETTDYRYSHYAYVNDTGKAFDMAIKALEKQGLEKRKSEKSMRIETEKLIEEQPTVYDVDKVVSELYDKSFERYGNSAMGGELVVNLDDAVEIAKRGGVDESK
jgi:arginyl-tRNA synthetase